MAGSPSRRPAPTSGRPGVDVDDQGIDRRLARVTSRTQVTPDTYIAAVTTQTPRAQDFTAAAAAYLGGGGQGVVRKYVRMWGLPKNLEEDVAQDALTRAVRVRNREGPAWWPDDLEPFVAELIRRSARDVIRGHLRRPEGHAIAAADAVEIAASSAEDADPGPEDQAIDAVELDRLGPHVDALRRHLGVQLADRPPRAAGALAVVAIVHGQAEPAEDCPQPKAGVDPAEGNFWAGLFYGGEPGCFPTAITPEDAAMRKRRSRALAHLKTLLQGAAADLGTAMETDDA